METFDDLVNEVLSEEEEPEARNADGTFAEKCEAFSGEVRRHFLEMGPVELERLQTDADVRFSDSLPLNRVRETTVALVGLGGLGNWIWRVLLGMGFRRVHVFDDDVVGVENIGPQAHKATDIGLPKVEAVRREALAFRGVELFAHNMRVGSESDICAAMGGHPDILIGATDSAEFRNAIIEGFERDVSSCGVELFLDLRMSLGDWNAFAFTPRAVAGYDGFGSGNPELKAAYDRYRKVAVFDPSDAVQEPCTARAITYTGANVASYVGAFLHWWMGGGGELCASDPDFLASTYYCDERPETGFNWLYRFSSRDFGAVTETAAKAKRNRRACLYVQLEASVRARMEREWGDAAITYATLEEPGDLHGCSATLHAEAYVNMAGETHLYQPCIDESRTSGTFVDFNLTMGSAEMIVAKNFGGGNWSETELSASNVLSPDRVASSMLQQRSVVSGLLANCGWALLGESESADPTWNVLYSRFGDESWSMLALVARPVSRWTPGDDEDGKLLFGFELWKLESFECGFSRVDSSLLPLELSAVEMAEWSSMTGWRSGVPDAGGHLVFKPRWWRGVLPDGAADMSGRLEELRGALLEDGMADVFKAVIGAVESGSTRLRDVPDGVLVELNGIDGRFSKQTDDSGRPYLVDGDARIDVPPDAEVTVAS